MRTLALLILVLVSVNSVFLRNPIKTSFNTV